ncbi:MAG: hypothetical protein J5574_02080 [Lachnospiraceae bacterium]|nr:hypothetical protein [Lachnospiraceae bacterium]
MDKNQILKMLQDQVHAKADPETIEKLRNVKSPKDALPILENLSIDLDDEMLSAVSGGGNGELGDSSWCSIYCPDHVCDRLFE